MKSAESYSAYVLALALSALVILSSCGFSSSPPSQLNDLPKDLTNVQLEANGIYPDGWTAAAATFSLQQPADAEFLLIRGTIPEVGKADFQTVASIIVDGRETARRQLPAGNFELLLPVSRGEGKRRIGLAFSQAQVLPEGDNRSVGARLTFIGFESEKSGVHDIVRGPGLQLGDGWGGLETFNKETFRWVDNDAKLIIDKPRQGLVELSILLEPGPGVGDKGFVLKTLDATGTVLGAEFFQGRRPVKILLPVETGKRNEFRLHLDGGGKRTSTDPRILNFRVFTLELS